jgi:geranylgeranyl pyrophosphate synthase
MPEEATDFEQFFRDVQAEIRKEIGKRFNDEDIRYAMLGGKLLRPVMLILSFKACNGKNEKYKKAIESAIGVELAHSASLIHDDIMDGDTERRGKLALHAVKGIGAAILIGHKMINEAFRISLEHGENNAKIFLDTWNETLNGQLKDIDFTSHIENLLLSRKPEKLLDEYFRIIEMKTASLFAAACRAGAIEAGAEEKVILLMREYGREVGIAYQLADDLVDIIEGKKIEEGIIMPIVRMYGKNVDKSVLENIKKEGKKLIEEMLHEGGKDIKGIYEKEIKKHIKKAVEIASSNLLNDTVYRKLLKEAPFYIVNEMIKGIEMRIEWQ